MKGKVQNMKSDMFKITTAAVIGLGILAFQGCGTTSIEGSWNVTKVQMDGMDKPKKLDDAVKEVAQNYGEDISEEELQQEAEILSGISLTFYENGSMNMSQGGYGISVNGTWRESGDDVYTIHANSETTDVTLDGKELIMKDYSGDYIYIFEKN